MTTRITGRTHVFALLGQPVGHSLSPAMQGAAMRDQRLDAVYVALPCSTARVAPLMRALAEAGGGGNVTVPHKGVAAAALDRATRAVERTGACNTFWHSDGLLWGDNTDVSGFRGALRDLLPAGVGGASVLLLGAGGAARAALCGLIDEGVSRVVVHNRTPAKAAEMVAAVAVVPPDADATGVPSDSPIEVSGALDEVLDDSFDVVVQATSLGLAPADPLPLDLDRLRRPAAVFDLVYASGGTPLVRRARASGMRAADGSEMLVLQGAAAFQRWFGREAPVEVMRGALAAR